MVITKMFRHPALQVISCPAHRLQRADFSMTDLIILQSVNVQQDVSVDSLQTLQYNGTFFLAQVCSHTTQLNSTTLLSLLHNCSTLQAIV